jgi:hypothetical protein
VTENKTSRDQQTDQQEDVQGDADEVLKDPLRLVGEGLAEFVLGGPTVGGPSPYVSGWPKKVGLIFTELLPVVGELVPGIGGCGRWGS